MGLKPILVLGVCFGIAAAGHLARAQAPAQGVPAPKFEVISIEPLDPNRPPIANAGGPFKPGGEYSSPNTMVELLLLQAYGVQILRLDLHALPDWAKTARYSIDAKPAENFSNLPPAENVKQIQLMLRSLLADRFHAVVHHETRQTPVYEMTLAGEALKNATTGDASQAPGGGVVAQDDIVRLRGNNVTMSAYGDFISAILGRPVIDKTGLNGVYNFDVRRQALASGAAPPVGGGCGPDCQSLVIGVLSDELGLKLHATTAPVDILVLDHVEKPSPN